MDSPKQYGARYPGQLAKKNLFAEAEFRRVGHMSGFAARHPAWAYRTRCDCIAVQDSAAPEWPRHFCPCAGRGQVQPRHNSERCYRFCKGQPHKRHHCSTVCICRLRRCEQENCQEPMIKQFPYGNKQKWVFPARKPNFLTKSSRCVNCAYKKSPWKKSYTRQAAIS